MQIHLRDGSTINITGSVLDVVHSPSDPEMILVKDGLQTLLWIEAANFQYAQAV